MSTPWRGQDFSCRPPYVEKIECLEHRSELAAIAARDWPKNIWVISQQPQGCERRNIFFLVVSHLAAK